MNEYVDNKRIIYTPSKFAKESLIYLQEVGISKTKKNHTSSRKYMDSFLFMIIIEGNGFIEYDNNKILLSTNDCAFINCHKPYSHSSNNWKIAWVHFYGFNVSNIYEKFINRNHSHIFHSNKSSTFIDNINNLVDLSCSNDYTKDMKIYNQLTELLSNIMSETIYYGYSSNTHKYNIEEIRNYIDNHYLEKLSLDSLSAKFYINKFYLTRAFKKRYGKTINNYILEKKITKSKEELRFSNKSINDISNMCGFDDPNYYSRVFKKIEGLSPKEYQKTW